MNDRDSRSSRLLVEARAALAQWDISGAKSAIFAALKHSQQDSAYDVEHKSWMALAIAQRAEDEHEAALHSLIAAESAARAASDILAFACARMSRCACLVGVGRWPDAHSLRQALVREHGDEVMARAMVEPHVDGSLLLSLASAYMEVDIDRARAAFERAIVVSTEPIMEARAYAGLGRVLDALELYDEAVLAFTRLAELAEGLGQSEFAAQVQKWIDQANRLRRGGENG